MFPGGARSSCSQHCLGDAQRTLLQSSPSGRPFTLTPPSFTPQRPEKTDRPSDLHSHRWTLGRNSGALADPPWRARETPRARGHGDARPPARAPRVSRSAWDSSSGVRGPHKVVQNCAWEETADPSPGPGKGRGGRSARRGLLVRRGCRFRAQGTRPSSRVGKGLAGQC